jgi:hypothetical protein
MPTALRPLAAFRAAALTAALVLGLLAALAGPLRAEEPGAAIRGVIERQLDAFARDDWAAAFEFASPAIRRMFGTPDRFGAMVRGGYPMVWRPARVEPGALETGPRGPVQIMLFEDAAGALWEAAYEMIEIDGAWRIDGVRISRTPDAAV